MDASKSILDEISQPALFQKISDICAAVNSVIDEKELLEISLKQTMDLFGASRGSIFIVKENGKDLILKSAQGMESAEEETLVKRMGEGVVGQVAQLKKPVFVDDINNDKRFQDYKARGSYRTPSFICAPLIIKDKLIGVINIADKDTGKRFNKNEMQLLDFLTSQIALNYRRIQLYNKFKKILRETRSLKDKLGQSDQETQHLRKQVFIQEKLASIGKLAGGIAHEFNNPLDGVMRYTNLCLEHINEDEVVRGYLLEIKHGLNRMANIVKNLLACSRNEFPSRIEVAFKDALDHSIAYLQPDISHKNITVEKKVSEDIPKIADFGLERILVNLLHNAIDAMEEGGRITVEAYVENDILIICIKDTGCGVAAEEIEQIFEPFYTTKDIDKGCGLGLTIVGEIVKNYDGKIDVESQPEKGSTFCVRLPIAK